MGKTEVTTTSIGEGVTQKVSLIRTFATRLLRILDFAHRQANVCFGNLNTKKVLLGQNGEAHLYDFSSATSLDKSLRLNSAEI